MSKIQHNDHSVIVADDTRLQETVEAHFRALFKAITEVILIIKKDGAFARVDAEKMGLNYTEGEEFAGKSLTEVYAPDIAALILKNTRRSLKSHQTVNIEYHLTHCDEVRWFAAAISPMTDDLTLCVVRDITELKITQDKLGARIVQLEERNRTLDLLIDKMKESNKSLEKTMFFNLKTFVLPHIERLKKMNLTNVQMAYVELIETNLSKFTSPLIHDLRKFNLTRMEIQVANLIKDGRTTREIASLLHTSKIAIDNHRYNIRKKFGICNKKENLRSFLLSLN